jgi:Mrp family chromosome partitioning ATPase/predicted Fe-Mo cluster-binding NifX family protein
MQGKDEAEKLKLRGENLGRIKNTVVVMSGKGGVGKSTVTVNLSYALASLGNRVGIMDIDFHGPSIAKMTGIEGKLFDVSKSDRPMPIQADKNIFVLSMASLLAGSDSPVIWRGPMKMVAIQQFLEDFDWPELDYLIVDCPPGTGDEPLSIIQTIGNVTGTIIVSTPQDLAFLDARKTITFSQQLNAPILGIIENMSGFICPKCGEKINIFKTGGAEKAAIDFDLNILGFIPIETGIVESGDNGKPYVNSHKKSEGGKVFMEIAKKVIDKIKNNAAAGSEKAGLEKNAVPGKEKIAIPVDDGVVSEHFGHAGIFAVYHTENGAVVKKEELVPPPHEPGVIPKWLNTVGATIIITGGIGQSAINMFNGFGINVLSGAPAMKADDLIDGYLKNEITFKGGTCSHDHPHGSSCGH